MAAMYEAYEGAKIGRFTLEEAIYDEKSRKRKWLCRCACGTRKLVKEWELRAGKVQSCGCLIRERASRRCQKHDCMYHSASGCDFFILEGHTRLSIHEFKSADVNSPCQEYKPGKNPLATVQPFTIHKDLLE